MLNLIKRVHSLWESLSFSNTLKHFSILKGKKQRGNVDSIGSNCRRSVLLITGALILLGQVRNCDEEDLSKKQVWVEYDAMKGYANLTFDIFKGELKTADTTRRLNVINDNHEITPALEWLTDSNVYGEDEIYEFLEQNRSIINTFINDSQGVYICAVRRMVVDNDSDCPGISYRNADTSMHNETMAAIAVATTRDSCLKYNVILSNKLEYFVAHELGHAFNLVHCLFAGCIMKTDAPWNTYYTVFCSDCRNKIMENRP